LRLRVLLALGALAALAGLVAVRGSGRGVGDGVTPVPRAWALPSPAPARSDVPGDAAAVRDIFRYADQPDAHVRPRPGHPPRVDDEGDAGTPSARPHARLVGLVRRAGRLVAALAIDGEVVLLAPGESASGYTLLAVGEEGIRLRGPDGHEEALALP
jgi:hypothetical protein